MTEFTKFKKKQTRIIYKNPKIFFIDKKKIGFVSERVLLIRILFFFSFYWRHCTLPVLRASTKVPKVSDSKSSSGSILKKVYDEIQKVSSRSDKTFERFFWAFSRFVSSADWRRDKEAWESSWSCNTCYTYWTFPGLQWHYDQVYP